MARACIDGRQSPQLHLRVQTQDPPRQGGRGVTFRPQYNPLFFHPSTRFHHEPGSVRARSNIRHGAHQGAEARVRRQCAGRPRGTLALAIFNSKNEPARPRNFQRASRLYKWDGREDGTGVQC